MAFIGLLSDTHGIFDDKLENFFRDVDEIWHAGDFGNVEVSDKISSLKPLKGVYGNCDGQEIRRIHPYIQSFELEGMKFLIMHIGGYSGRYHYNAIQLINAHLPDVFICGHSHIPNIVNEQNNNILTINPGAAGVQWCHE